MQKVSRFLHHSSNNRELKSEIMQKEIWKDVKGFEGRYIVSNFGNVKTIIKGNDLVLRSYIANSGYLFLRLFKDKKFYNRYIHSLVAIAFLNHGRNSNLVIDHVDENKQNNRLDNLQLLSTRANIAKSFKNRSTSSKYIGVCLHKPSGTWFSRILINDKREFLGAFEHELEAALAYKKALNNINK